MPKTMRAQIQGLRIGAGLGAVFGFCMAVWKGDDWSQIDGLLDIGGLVLANSLIVAFIGVCIGSIYGHSNRT
jgi:hypothetical protein